MSDQDCPAPPLVELTAKQKEAVRLLVDCHSNKEIARLLNISPSTVEQRLATVRRKYGLLSRREVQRYFRQSDLAKLEDVFIQTSEAQVALPDTGTGEIGPKTSEPETLAMGQAPSRVWVPVLSISLGFLLGLATTVLASLFGVVLADHIIR
ncbi:response regulator transcription factor [Novosphingobium ginsenosidimutans]|nr:helix-turn-helix transcriptional regulator [Novosphingobium ginsenosidimutans]